MNAPRYDTVSFLSDYGLRDEFVGIAKGVIADIAPHARVMLGAAALLDREPLDAKGLRERVTSPNGTTAAGIAKLDEEGVREAFMSAVRAASRRSKELGDANKSATRSADSSR